MEIAVKIASEHQFILRKYGASSPQILLAETVMLRNTKNEVLLQKLQEIYVTGTVADAFHCVGRMIHRSAE